jgi:hypothetical protein
VLQGFWFRFLVDALIFERVRRRRRGKLRQGVKAW